MIVDIDEEAASSREPDYYQEEFWVFSIATVSQQKTAAGLGVTSLALTLLFRMLFLSVDVQNKIPSLSNNGVVRLADGFQVFMLSYSCLYLVSH